jgi:hypothetical protein
MWHARRRGINARRARKGDRTCECSVSPWADGAKWANDTWPMVDATTAEGGCNCGEIRYLVTRPFLTVYICHCHLCQKRTGSAYSMSVVIPADGLLIVAGKPLHTQRRLPGGGTNVSWICPACYSRILTRREGRSVLNLRAGTLDDTSKIRPVAQFWTDSAQPWALVTDNILSYATQPADYAPLLAAWKAISQPA